MGGGWLGTEASYSCDFQWIFGSSKPSLGSLTQHIPQPLKIDSQVPWNGNSLPNLVRPLRSWKIYLYLPSWIPSLSMKAVCWFDLSLDARNKRRVWECPETACKYSNVHRIFCWREVLEFSKRLGTPIMWGPHSTGEKQLGNFFPFLRSPFSICIIWTVSQLVVLNENTVKILWS